MGIKFSGSDAGGFRFDFSGANSAAGGSEGSAAPKRERKPRKAVGTPGKRIAINTLVTLLVGAVYFYLELPAINLHAEEFYGFVLLLCAVYCGCALLTSGFQGEGAKGYFRFVKKQCTVPFFLAAGLLALAVVGGVASWVVFRAGSYQKLLTVQSGDFSSEIAEVAYDRIPMLDKDSAEKLGDRGLCGALYTGVAHVDHLALAAAEPRLAGHERVHACGGSAHGRRQGLLAHKNARGSGVVGVDKAKGVVRRDKASLGKRGDNVRGRGGHKQAHVLCRHALRGLPQVQTEQLERNRMRAVERHEVDESHQFALLCGYSFHSFGRSRVRRRSHWRQRDASRSASDSAKGHSYCLKLSRRSAAGAILGSSGAS